MENTIIILAEIVYACVVTLKKGGFKVKLHLKDEISQLKNGEEIMSKDIFIFPSQLIEAFAANVPMDIMRLTPTQLAAALRGAKATINVALSDDEEFTNFSIDKLMLSDAGIEMLAEDSIMAVLDAKSRERRAERNAAKAMAAAKAAMAAMAEEFETSTEAHEEPTEAPALEESAEAPAEPELTPRQIAARRAAETRRRNRLAAEAAQA